MATVTKVSKFITSDGAEFEKSIDATKHEGELELVELIGTEALAKLRDKFRLVGKRAPRKPKEVPATPAPADAGSENPAASTEGGMPAAPAPAADPAAADVPKKQKK